MVTAAPMAVDEIPGIDACMISSSGNSRCIMGARSKVAVEAHHRA
jgi:hypothetical protein